MIKPRGTSQTLAIILFFAGLFLYIFLASNEIMLPGLCYDECLAAEETIKLLINLRDRAYSGAFPIMNGPYLPALESYLLLPSFMVFGINVISLRLTSIAFGLLTLIFLYFFVKDFFNRGTALFTMFLLITSPNFILGTKVGNYSHSYWLFFAVSSLFFFLRWHRAGKLIFYLCGVFLLGLGFSQLAWFIIFIIGLFVLSFVFCKDIRDKLPKNRIEFIGKYIILGLFIFSIGNFLFIYGTFFDPRTKYYIFKYMLSNTHTHLGINNLDYIHNLGMRFRQVGELLYEENMIYSLDLPSGRNYVYGFMFFLSSISLFLLLLFKKKMYFYKKKIIFIILLVTIMIFVSPYTLTCFQVFHLFILVPFLYLIIIVSITETVFFIKNIRLKKMVKSILFICLLILAINNFKIMFNRYLSLKLTGGNGVWSDSIYSLADFVRAKDSTRLVSLNTFPFSNLYLLLEGKKRIYRINETWSEKMSFYAGDMKNLAHFFEAPDNIYLFNVRGGKGPDLIKAFMAYFKMAVENSGKKLLEEKIFCQRDGEPAYVVYSIW